MSLDTQIEELQMFFEQQKQRNNTENIERLMSDSLLQFYLKK